MTVYVTGDALKEIELEELYLVENDYVQELEDIEREMEFAEGRVYDGLAKNQASVLDKLEQIRKDIVRYEDELGADEFVDGCWDCRGTGEGRSEGLACFKCKGKGY